MRSLVILALCLVSFAEPAFAGRFRFRRRVSDVASSVSDCAARVTAQHFSAPGEWRIEPRAQATPNPRPCPADANRCDGPKATPSVSGSKTTQSAPSAASSGLRSLITNASYTGNPASMSGFQSVGQIIAAGDAQPPNAQMLGELVRELPSDAGKWHTVVVCDESIESQRLKNDFATHPELRRLLAQTHHTAYTPNDPMFRDRYAPYVGEGFPQVWLLKPDGARIYKASGKGPQGVPSGDQLAAELAASIAMVTSADCPNCPVRPAPYQPGPAPMPPRPGDQFVPDLRPPGLASPSGMSIELIVCAAIVGFAALIFLGAALWSARPPNPSESLS
jgi:hypothetical protein